MASTRDPTGGSSSSEATDTENSCTERYDCEKSPSISNSRRRGGNEALRRNPGESIISCSDSENEELRPVGNSPGEPEFFDSRNDDDSPLRHNRHRSDRLVVVDDGQKHQQPRSGKRSISQRPASVKSAGSYEIPDRDFSCPPRRGFESDLNTAQHEHYMIPTHEPNRPTDKQRTLSLFNPDFLPNFNDMLMYVGRSSPARDRDSYRSNIEDTPPWDNSGSPSILDSCYSQQRFDNNVASVRVEGVRDFSQNIESSYASLRLRDRPSHHQLRDQDCDNYYAPVGLQAFQSQGTIDYNC